MVPEWPRRLPPKRARLTPSLMVRSAAPSNGGSSAPPSSLGRCRRHRSWRRDRDRRPSGALRFAPVRSWPALPARRLGRCRQLDDLRRKLSGKSVASLTPARKIAPVEGDRAAAGHRNPRRAVEFGDDVHRGRRPARPSGTRGRRAHFLRRVSVAQAVAIEADAERKAARRRVGAVGGRGAAVQPGDRRAATASSLPAT